MTLPANYLDRSVCIIGLGYVGLTLAVAMAEAGFDTYGIERDPRIVDAVASGKAHFQEAGLNPRLAAQVHAGKLRVGHDWPNPGTCRVFIITVGTPLDGDGRTNLDAIRAVATSLAGALVDDALVVLRSTVRIGVSREVVKPLLDVTGLSYDLAFCPERTLEGRALQELRSLPQIVGGLTQTATVRASQLFNFITPTTVRVRDLETAEMIKLANNTQRDLMFGFANEIADLCDHIGVSAIEVISAGNMGYSRSTLPMPGPVGGPCLEKDPYILAEGAALHGGRSRLALLGREINEELPKIAVGRALDAVQGEVSKVALMGLAFKGRPETSDLRGSVVVPLIKALREALPPDVRIVGYDPAVGEEDTTSLGIHYAETAGEAFEAADCVIFQNNNARFDALDMSSLSQALRPNAVIYDLWNQFDAQTLSLRSDVLYFGYGTQILKGQAG